jgi:hypothetical protein
MTALMLEADDLTRIQAMDTAALWEELENGFRVTARHLLYLAAVWRELESRGEDLSRLRTGIAAYLPLIAGGAVLPETVVRFVGKQHLLRRIAALPGDKQEELLGRGTVPLAVYQDGGYTDRFIPLNEVTPSMAKVIFGDRCIRSLPEQVARLSAPSRPLKPHRPPKRGKLRADRERGVILFGKKQLAPADVLAALADLAGSADEGVDSSCPSVSTRVTPAEHERLKRRAASGTSVATLIRNALRATGMI